MAKAKRTTKKPAKRKTARRKTPARKANGQFKKKR
jgi:hypothetical protein